ncbi:unnamed protein product, partial [Trichobilharzia szidati]
KCPQEVKLRVCYETKVRYYYDSKQNKCLQYGLRECAANTNSFNSRRMCLAQCVK